jgi:hypothetical protein
MTEEDKLAKVEVEAEPAYDDGCDKGYEDKLAKVEVKSEYDEGYDSGYEDGVADGKAIVMSAIEQVLATL